jgi:hypothetical protein
VARGAGVAAPYVRGDWLLVWIASNWTVFDGWCAARNIDPLSLPVRRMVALAWHAITEHANDDMMDEIEQAIAAHERLLSGASIRQTGVPLWWNEADVDAEAAAFAAAFR